MTLHRLSPFVPVLSLALACGGSATDDQGGDGDGDDDLPAATGGTGTGGAGTGGAATGGSADPAGGTTGTEFEAADLYPFTVGNTWTYQVEEKVVGVCPEEKRTTMFIEETVINGRPAIIGNNICYTEVLTTLSNNAGNIEQYVEEEDRWFVSFENPLDNGTVWDPLDGLTFYWEDAGTVTVPAGTFDNCWHRRSVQFPNTNTYCVGMGLVRIDTSEFTAELLEYSIAQ